jgi:hypothetical protein
MYTIVLLEHELRKRRTANLLTLLIIAGLFGYSFRLLAKVAHPGEALVLPAAALIFPLVLWACWSHWQSLREEWQERTNCLLFSFPVRGWQVLSAKGGATALAFVVFSLLSAILGGLLLVTVFHRAPLGGISAEELRRLLMDDGSKIYLQYLLFTFSLLGFSQLAFVLGQLAPRWHGLVSAGGFVLVFYVVGTVTTWLEPLLRLLPQVEFSFGRSFNPWFTVLFFLCSLLAAAFAGWLLDRRVDF